MKQLSFFVLLVFLFVVSAQGQQNRVDSLKKILLSSKKDSNRVNHLIDLGEAEWYNFPDSISKKKILEYYYEGLELAKELRFVRGQIKAVIRIGISYLHEGKISEAIQLYRQLLRSVAQNGPLAQQASVYIELSFFYKVLAKFEVTLMYLLEAKRLAVADSNTALIARVNYQIGELNANLEQYARGIRYVYNARKVFEQLNDSVGLSKCAYILGFLYKNQNRFEEAIESYNLDLHYQGKKADDIDSAETRQSIGQVYHLQKKYAAAVTEYRYALEVMKKINSPAIFQMLYESLGSSLKEFGYAEMQKGNVREGRKSVLEGLDYLKKALQLAEAGSIAIAIGYTNADIGSALFYLGRFSESRKYYEAAIAHAKSIGHKYSLIESYRGMSQLDSVAGKAESALKYYELHILYRDSVNNRKNLQESEELKKQFELEKKEDELKLLSAQSRYHKTLASTETLEKNIAYTAIAFVLVIGCAGFYLYTKKRALQTKQMLIHDRLRISRELHDEVGATLSGVAMFSHLAKQQISARNLPEAERSFGIMQQSTSEMVTKLNDIVWLVSPDEDSLEKFVRKLVKYAEDMVAAKKMKIQVTIPDNFDDINMPLEAKKNIYLFCKEAINNAVKYSNGTLLKLEIVRINNQLEFSVTDNGQGFDEVTVRRGNGLNNMQKRADEVGANLILDSAKNKGAKVAIRFSI